MADYDFVGHLNEDPDDVYSQVKQMFEHTAEVPREHPTFWQVLSDRFSGREHIDWRGHNTNARTKLKSFYRSPETYELVRRAYDADYKLPGLKDGPWPL